MIKVMKTPTMTMRLNLMKKTVRLQATVMNNSEADNKDVKEIIDDNHNNNDEDENNKKKNINKSG